MNHYLMPAIPPNDCMTRIIVECYIGWGMGFTGEGYARLRALRQREGTLPVVVARREASGATVTAPALLSRHSAIPDARDRRSP